MAQLPPRLRVPVRCGRGSAGIKAPLPAGPAHLQNSFAVMGESQLQCALSSRLYRFQALLRMFRPGWFVVVVGRHLHAGAIPRYLKTISPGRNPPVASTLTVFPSLFSRVVVHPTYELPTLQSNDGPPDNPMRGHPNPTQPNPKGKDVIAILKAASPF